MWGVPVTGRVPKKTLHRARRTLCRRIGAAVVSAMAETDTDFATIDMRLGQRPGTAKQWLDGLIAGTEKRLNVVSDLFHSMNCEITLSLRPLPEDGEESEPPA